MYWRSDDMNDEKEGVCEREREYANVYVESICESEP